MVEQIGQMAQSRRYLTRRSFVSRLLVIARPPGSALVLFGIDVHAEYLPE
jgi:hypothetical protein